MGQITTNNLKNNNDGAAADTSTVNRYTYINDSAIALISFNPDTSQGTLYTQNYFVDGFGWLGREN